jgi:hypothetical protein
LKNIVKLKKISTIKVFPFGFGLHFLPTTIFMSVFKNRLSFDNSVLFVKYTYAYIALSYYHERKLK